MGLFDLLRKDPTSTWPKVPPRRLKLVVPEMKLDGVAPGASWEALARFGRPDNPRPLKEGVLRHLDKGLVFEVTEGRVDYFALVFQDSLDEGFSPCAALLDGPAGVLELSPAARYADLERHLGAAVRVDRDDEETVYDHEVGGYAVEIECTPDDRLQRINVFLVS